MTATPTIGWSRRRFLIGSIAAGITLAFVPLAVHASFVDDETMPAAPGWSGDGFGHPRYRIDGYAKATGAKLYARDFRAADMEGWPDTTDHAMLLLASDATHRFAGIDLTMLAPDLQPDRVVTAEDLEAALWCKPLYARRRIRAVQSGCVLAFQGRMGCAPPGSVVDNTSPGQKPMPTPRNAPKNMAATFARTWMADRRAGDGRRPVPASKTSTPVVWRSGRTTG